jgi:protein-S-isoprenylcysteine O-methyltransferase Ste14
MCPVYSRRCSRLTPQPRVRNSSASAVARTMGLLIGAGAFLASWTFFACFIAFLGNLPRRSSPWIDPAVDSGTAMVSPMSAVLSDLALITIFGLQHSVMARPAFKAWLTRHVPSALERTTYVYAACAAGFLLILLWQPIPIIVWSVGNDVLRVLVWTAFAGGWLLLFGAALSIDILELLGLKQAWTYYSGRPLPEPTLKTGWLYRWLPHPMYAGVLLGMWCAPDMTIGHLLLSSGLTTYLVIGMAYEERDLEVRFGRAYTEWRHASAPACKTITTPHLRSVVDQLRTIYRPVGPDRLPAEIAIGMMSLRAATLRPGGHPNNELDQKPTYG